MENYIRDKYERKLFMTDDGSTGTGRMYLNDKSKNNLMDSEVSYEQSSTNTFKNSSSDSFNTNYSKQLTLLSEMGFTDTEFNYKTLKAANGNMQEALEIIVAANNKQRRKTVDKNIFDEIEEVKPQSTSSQHAPKNEQIISFQSPPMDDWGFESSSVSKVENSKTFDVSEHSEIPKIDEPAPVTPVESKQSNTNNPWDDNFVEDSSAAEKDSKKSEDPFDSYKAFRSTTDTYFDNPW